MKKGLIHYIRTWAAVTAAMILISCGHTPAPQSSPTAVLQYPAAPRGTQVDQYGSVSVADPYRWFEDLDSAQTKSWVNAENSVSQPYLEAIPARGSIKQRLTELWNYERFNIPLQEGGRYFWLRNDGLQNQSVLFVADGLQASPRVLLDPNALEPRRYRGARRLSGESRWSLSRLRTLRWWDRLEDLAHPRCHHRPGSPLTSSKFAKFTQVSWGA